MSAVNLVSLGSDTHQSDMDQHFVPLSFTQSGSSLTIQAPSGGTYAPPGHYMLFILNANGVPVGRPDHLGRRAAPTAPVGARPASPRRRWTAAPRCPWTAPSNGGSPITSYTVTPYIGSAAQPADRGQRIARADEHARSPA